MSIKPPPPTGTKGTELPRPAPASGVPTQDPIEETPFVAAVGSSRFGLIDPDGIGDRRRAASQPPPAPPPGLGFFETDRSKSTHVATVIVTGGSDGIGNGIAKVAAERYGPERVVYIGFRPFEKVPEANRIPGALYIQADVTDKGQLEATRAQILQRFSGGLGAVLLVPLAGVEVNTRDTSALRARIRSEVEIASGKLDTAQKVAVIEERLKAAVEAAVAHMEKVNVAGLRETIRVFAPDLATAGSMVVTPSSIVADPNLTMMIPGGDEYRKTKIEAAEIGLNLTSLDPVLARTRGVPLYIGAVVTNMALKGALIQMMAVDAGYLYGQGDQGMVDGFALLLGGRGRLEGLTPARLLPLAFGKDLFDVIAQRYLEGDPQLENPRKRTAIALAMKALTKIHPEDPPERVNEKRGREGDLAARIVALDLAVAPSELAPPLLDLFESGRMPAGGALRVYSQSGNNPILRLPMAGGKPMTIEAPSVPPQLRAGGMEVYVSNPPPPGEATATTSVSLEEKLRLLERIGEDNPDLIVNAQMLSEAVKLAHKQHWSQTTRLSPEERKAGLIEVLGILERHISEEGLPRLRGAIIRILVDELVARGEGADKGEETRRFGERKK